MSCDQGGRVSDEELALAQRLLELQQERTVTFADVLRVTQGRASEVRRAIINLAAAELVEVEGYGNGAVVIVRAFEVEGELRRRRL